MRKVEIRPYQINLTSLPGRANHQSKQHSQMPMKLGTAGQYRFNTMQPTNKMYNLQFVLKL
jgi:hypothetical protein